jgi:hypothetical protein
MNPITVQTILFGAMVVACVAGFLSCLTLFSYTKFRKDGKPAVMRCLYQWGCIFFAGACVLCLNWMMADRAPVPMRRFVDDSDRIGFAAVMLVWWFSCLAFFLVHRAYRVVRKPMQTPEGRSHQIALRLAADSAAA